ncbi:hypothetical protein PMAYCL1PPCAC_32162, partial [Pristionchus mayeri]
RPDSWSEEHRGRYRRCGESSTHRTRRWRHLARQPYLVALDGGKLGPLREAESNGSSPVPPPTGTREFKAVGFVQVQKNFDP